MASFEVELNADKATDSASKLTDSMGGLVEKMTGAGGASDGLVSKMGGLAESIDPVSLAITVAVAALTALVGALAAGAAAAISITQQRDALRSTFDALGGGAGAGEKTLAMLDRLGKTLPFTTDQMGKWAKSLMAAGIQGPALEQAIKAVAAATAIMGEQGGAAADKLIKKLSEAAATGAHVKIDKGFLKQLAASGVSAESLAKQLGTTPDKLAKMNLSAQQLGDAMQKALIEQGKGPLENMGLTWDSISAKLKEGLSSMFEGLGPDVKAFMTEVKSLFAEFNKGTAATKTGGSIMKAVFHTLFAAATAVVHGIHEGFLRLQIAFYKTKIALAPITSAIGKLLPAGIGVKILVGIVKGLAVVFGLLAVAVVIALIPLAILVAAIVAVGFVIYEIISAIGAAIDWLTNLGTAAAEAGSNFVAGLINGIKSGAGALVSAVVELAKGAVSALKGALGIHSPSRVSMAVGGNVTGTLADTVADGAADVHAAAKGVGGAVGKGLAAGADGAPGAAGKAGASSGSGGGITIEAGAIVVNGAGKDWQEVTEEAMALVFERIALRQGLVTQ